MGSKLEGVKGKSREGTNSFNKGSELGRKNVSDVKQMKAIYDSLPSDVEEEVKNSAKMVAEAIKTEATADMNTNVKTEIDSGKEKMNSSSSDSSKQIANNDNAKGIFAQMDGVAGFGKGARSDAATTIDNVTKQFEAVITDNQNKTTQAETDFTGQMNEIEGTF